MYNCIDVHKTGSGSNFKGIYGLSQIAVQNLRARSADINPSLLQRISTDCLNRSADRFAINIVFNLEVADYKHITIIIRTVNHTVFITAHLVDITLLQAIVINKADRAAGIHYIDTLICSENQIVCRISADRANGHDIQPLFFSIIGQFIIWRHLYKEPDIRADPQTAVLRNTEAHHTFDTGETLKFLAVITYQPAITACINKAVWCLCDRHISQKGQARVDIEYLVIVLGFKTHLVPA